MASDPQAGHQPPPIVMLHMIFGHFFTQAIYVAAKLGLADRLQAGPRPVDELAAEAGVHPQALQRVLRLLASAGVFSADGEGRVGLTPLADTLRPGVPGSMYDMALLMGRPMHWRAVGELAYSVETGQPSFDHAWGIDLYRHCAANPEDAAIFNGAMGGFAGPTAAAVADTYDFSASRLLVDVGGGVGIYMRTFLNANPALRGILFDQPHVAESARRTLDEAGLAGRCEVVAGDFFQSVPAGGDTYILEDIIHNWDDERAERILGNIHQSMAPGGTLLLVETVIPPGNGPHFGKQMDVIMLTLFAGGRERTEEEFRALFARTGFELTRIVPTHTLMSVVEARRI
jgi:hypothetical protein